MPGHAMPCHARPHGTGWEDWITSLHELEGSDPEHEHAPLLQEKRPLSQFKVSDHVT